MPFKICLPSLSLHRDSIAVFSEQFDQQTLFQIDRLVRQSVRKNPSIQTHEMQAVLAQSGFAPASVDDNEPLFLHGRAWDEHLVCGSHTFFVEFPDSAPYELAGKIFLASSAADIFTIVSETDEGDRGVVIFTEEHEPIYSTDTAFKDELQQDRVPLGPVRLPEEQFDSEVGHKEARALLEKSGFEVLEPEMA